MPQEVTQIHTCTKAHTLFLGGLNIETALDKPFMKVTPGQIRYKGTEKDKKRDMNTFKGAFFIFYFFLPFDFTSR